MPCYGVHHQSDALAVRAVGHASRDAVELRGRDQSGRVPRQRKGAVVAKEDLLRDVWGFNCDIDSRRVDFQVAALRRKIENDPSRPRHLLTVRGVGYRLLP
ncbi:MAG: winged helix-turn-helix domain-containing protein [Longimicrobiales bacterium]